MRLFVLSTLVVSSLLQTPLPTPAKRTHFDPKQAQPKQQEATSNEQCSKELTAAINQFASEIATRNQQETGEHSQNTPLPDFWTKFDPITIFTAVLALLAFLQWRTMGEQAKYMKDALSETKKAADSAKASSDSLRNIERPWVLLNTIGRWSVKGPDGKDWIAFSWRIKNFGKTPALVEKIEGNIDIVPTDYYFPKEPIYTKPFENTYEQPIIPPGEVSFQIINAMQRGWQNMEMNNLIKGKFWLIASGHITYRDPFGELHETRFCLRSDRDVEPSTPVGPRKYNECT